MRIIKTVFIFAVIAICLGCEGYSTKINLSGGNYPSFEVSGSGKIIKLSIDGPRQREGDGPQAFAVWEFEPIGSTDNLDSLNNLKTIKYGDVPKGYKQIYPENNLPPPGLVENQKYHLQIFTDGAPSGQIIFKVSNGKAVKDEVKGYRENF